jgi:hypothetical protein
MSQYIVEFFTTMPLVWTLLSFAHRLTMCSVLPLVCPPLLSFAIPSTLHPIFTITNQWVLCGTVGPTY